MAYEGGIMPTVPIMGAGSGFGGDLGGILIGALLGGGLFGQNRYGAGAGAGYAVNEAGEARFEGLSNQINGLQTQISTSGLSGEVCDLKDNICNGFLNSNNLTGSIGRDILSGQGQTNANLATGNFTTLSSINGLGNQITAQNNQNALQTLNSFNQLNTTTLQGFNEIGRDTANATNQIIAGQNAMMAQNSACCCELREAICKDGQETRALINAINLSTIEGQLADAKSQVNTLNQTIAQTALLSNTASTIINHLKPVVV